MTHSRQIVPFQPRFRRNSKLPPPPRVSEEQTAPPALTVNPAHIKVQVCFSYLNEGRGGRQKLLVNLFARLL